MRHWLVSSPAKSTRETDFGEVIILNLNIPLSNNSEVRHKLMPTYNYQPQHFLLDFYCRGGGCTLLRIILGAGACTPGG